MASSVLTVHTTTPALHDLIGQFNEIILEDLPSGSGPTAADPSVVPQQPHNLVTEEDSLAGFPMPGSRSFGMREVVMKRWMVFGTGKKPRAMACLFCRNQKLVCGPVKRSMGDSSCKYVLCNNSTSPDYIVHSRQSMCAPLNWMQIPQATGKTSSADSAQPEAAVAHPQMHTSLKNRWSSARKIASFHLINFWSNSRVYLFVPFVVVVVSISYLVIGSTLLDSCFIFTLISFVLYLALLLPSSFVWPYPWIAQFASFNSFLIGLTYFCTMYQITTVHYARSRLPESGDW